MLGTQCRKPTVSEWFIPPIYGDVGDGSLLGLQYNEL